MTPMWKPVRKTNVRRRALGLRVDRKRITAARDLNLGDGTGDAAAAGHASGSEQHALTPPLGLSRGRVIRSKTAFPCKPVYALDPAVCEAHRTLSPDNPRP